MGRTASKDVIEIPRSVWETAETKEEVEDWLLAHNPRFIREMRRIRREEHLSGKGMSIKDLARKWNIAL